MERNETKLDVLAVMDRMRDCIAAHCLDVAQDERWHGILARHSEARAAVAELIEAAKLVNADHTAPHDCYATGPRTGNPLADLVACPGCYLKSALATSANLKEPQQ
jgi:hypothetical protein